VARSDDEISHGSRDQHLPGLRQREYPGADVDRDLPDVIAENLDLRRGTATPVTMPAGLSRAGAGRERGRKRQHVPEPTRPDAVALLREPRLIVVDSRS
jgi:hypothetical protein